MRFLAALVVFVAVVSLFVPRSIKWRLPLTIAFCALGFLFAVVGGYVYWWRPGLSQEERSALVFVCGVFLLLTQWGYHAFGRSGQRE